METKQYNIPIGFFVFNRIDTTKEVFVAIRKAKPKKLYIICDGAREEYADEVKKVNEVRKYIENNIDWPCKVKKNYSDTNMGCKNRMVSGINWLMDNEEMAIILEDDCRPTSEFFPYVEEMLNKYKDNEQIMIVSGSKLLQGYKMKNSYTFSHYAMIWGWATWRRAWKKYDIDIKQWKKDRQSGKLKKYYTKLGYIKARRDFDSVYMHQKDTWDHQWAYTILANDGLDIIPSVNMIENLGFGRKDATHTTNNTKQDFSVQKMKFPLLHPKKVKWDAKYDKAFQRYEWGIKAVLEKVIGKLTRCFCL